MAINLTDGAIAMLSNGETQGSDVKPVLQVADIRLVNTLHQSNQERYQILLSDGMHLQRGILATQKNDLVRSQRLQKGSVVQLTQFVCDVIQGRMIVIVIDLDVILEKCGPIGEPKKYENAINLTKGALAMLSSGEAQGSYAKPVLQVVDIWSVNTQHQSNDKRYLILLSDGWHLQPGMLATQKNDLVRSQRLQEGSVVQLTHFICNVIQGCMIIFVNDLEVILEKCDLIGERTQHERHGNNSGPAPVARSAPGTVAGNPPSYSGDSLAGSSVTKPNVARGTLPHNPKE